MRLAPRALLVAVVAAVTTQASAAMTAPKPLVTTPNSVVFWNAHDGLLGVGVCTSTRYACGTGAVQLTTDGGHTYRVLLRTRRPVESVQTAGPRGAIAVTFDKRVYRTLDRGRTWQSWHMHPGASFATPLIGIGFRTYQVGNSIRLRLLRTSDAGRHLAAAPTSRAVFLGVSGPRPRHAPARLARLRRRAGSRQRGEGGLPHTRRRQDVAGRRLHQPHESPRGPGRDRDVRISGGNRLRAQWLRADVGVTRHALRDE